MDFRDPIVDEMEFVYRSSVLLMAPTFQRSTLRLDFTNFCFCTNVDSWISLSDGRSDEVNMHVLCLGTLQVTGS